MVRIDMENGGIIDIELYEEIAPITCENFKKLRAVMKGIFTVGYAKNDEKFNKVTYALSKVTTLFRFTMIEYNTE